MGYTLFIAGARGTRTVSGKEFNEYGGETSCYVLTNGTYALVVDCGSGLTRAREILKTCTKVDVVLTHLHYDHIVGFLDMHAFPKGVQPRLHGTYHQWGLNQEKGFCVAPFWPIPINCSERVDFQHYTTYTLGEQGEIQVRMFPSNHPNEASIVKIQVEDKKILVMSDYEHGDPVHPELMEPYDVLMYDGMYTPEEYEHCKGYGHSTIEQGVILAKKMGAKKMLITHTDPNKTDDQLREADLRLQKEMPGSLIAKTGYRLEL